jgi:hypothetical protein
MHTFSWTISSSSLSGLASPFSKSGICVSEDPLECCRYSSLVEDISKGFV